MVGNSQEQNKITFLVEIELVPDSPLKGPSSVLIANVKRLIRDAMHVCYHRDYVNKVFCDFSCPSISVNIKEEQENNAPKHPNTKNQRRDL